MVVQHKLSYAVAVSPRKFHVPRISFTLSILIVRTMKIIIRRKMSLKDGVFEAELNNFRMAEKSWPRMATPESR